MSSLILILRFAHFSLTLTTILKHILTLQTIWLILLLQELWLYHLQRMCSGTDVNNETDFEAIVTKLMNIDGDSGMRDLIFFSNNSFKSLHQH